ncbi:hypothetical protein GCM10023213_14160 [Prosthecobacter algae]|uniref:Uncharacterized protein n=1 Tax=Prosthecobacter algae TaxID=1144682 RepID=A0ABP9NZJ4_9BACT
MIDILAHPDIWKLALILVCAVLAVLGIFILYIIWAIHMMRRDSERQFLAMSNAGAKRQETITKSIHTSELRVTNKMLDELKHVYRQINPLSDRVSKIEGHLDIGCSDDPEKDINTH